MELWDEVMGPSEPDFDRLGAVAKLRVATTAVKWTVEHFTPPIADEEIQRLVADITALLDSALAQDNGTVPMPSEIDGRIEDAMETVAQPGVSSILMASVCCFTGQFVSAGEAVFNALGSCYNAVVEQEFSGPFIDIEDERSNGRCYATIEFQQNLLSESL